MAEHALELRGVTKAFGDCVANRSVTFAVRAGSVHALIGENGAGKSTAMKMAYGMYRPDAGEIVAFGAPRAFRSPRAAAAAGIGMVHQHFMLAGPLSGLDNILLGAEPARASFLPIDRAAARAKLVRLAADAHLAVDLDKPVEELPVGVQQRLEILKLLYRDTRLLILDEPTAVLTPQETAELFANLKRLAASGRTIVIITHKLDEVMRLADHVTVMRRGEVVAERRTAETSEEELAALMVGRSVDLSASAAPAANVGAAVLELQGVTMAAKGCKPRLQGIDLVVRAGEIVGVAGVEGNGQTELVELLQDPQSLYQGKGGSLMRATGTLKVLGTSAGDLRPLELRSLGVGIVPEDRHRQGLVLDFDLARNFLLGLHRTPAFSRGGWLKLGALRERVKEVLARFDVRPADPDAKAAGLSGGNQQKVVIARELEREPKLFVCAQPTRGVDVGAIEFIHQRIVAARDAGAAVLLVSSSLQEIRALSDRIVVLYDGRIAGEFARGASEEELGLAMSGAKETRRA